MTIREYIRQNPKPEDMRPHDYFRLVGERLNVKWLSVEKPYYQEYKKEYTPPEPITETDYTPVSETVKEKHDARILIFDIETAPLKAYVWGKWGQDINDSFIIRDWFMLTWSAKWLFEDKVYSERLTGREVLDENDERITRSIWKMLDDASIVIAHNGVKFDIKRLNTRFLKHGLLHPSPYKVIDTLKVARQQFAITSNRLDYICQFLGIPGKADTPKGLWQKCSEGDDAALQVMENYNIQDIRALEDVYLLLRPYMRSHPNIGLHVADSVQCCASCGSNELTDCGEYQTTVNVYIAYRCTNCGSISRSRNSRFGADDRRHITSPIPR